MPSVADPFVSPSVPPALLVWEDADPQLHPAGERWWLARAHDATEDGVRDFIIAEDDITGYLVGLVRPRDITTFKVIAATQLSDAVHYADAIIDIKDQVAGWLITPRYSATLRFVRRWRWRRFWVIALANLPLAMAAFFIGGVLGIVITLVGVSSALVGWPMPVAGLLIGAGAGWALKFIADRKSSAGASAALAGSWGRFAVVSVAAVVGAGLGSGAAMTLFWS